MTKEVRELLDKISTFDNGPKRRSVLSADKCIINFIAHLHWLKSRHCKTTYSDKYLVSVAFQKPKRFGSDAEVAAYCRVHLCVAILQLEKVVTQMRQGKSTVSAHSLRRYKLLLRDYLHDLKPIAEYLERRKNKNYAFFEGAKFYGVMAWQIFRASSQLSIMSLNESIKLDHKVTHIAAIFMLRQALEAKFQRIVHVQIYDAEHQNPKLRHDFHYTFIKKNLSFYEFTSVSFELLEYIYTWCSVIVHKAYQPLVWQLSYALQVSSGLFSDGPLDHSGGWSINGGVRIKDTDHMQSSFAQHFCSSYDHGIWCLEPSTPEAVSMYSAI
ncbi:hypothetical protein [Nevskia ramosa]|uniref:hypothetical protein n=1 Tax=Nevskia ramosa TaxID=64002 RepID=UPI003D099271